MIDEKALIQKCLQGDSIAQRQLYNLFSKEMYGVCLRYARDNAEAQDFLQEGYIRVFKHLKDFQFKGSLAGWIKRIMVNTALRTLQTAYMRYETTPEIIPDTIQSPDIFSTLRAEEMLGYLRRLPQGYRTVFNLFVLEDYSHAEIAKELNITDSTSRSQLTKARQMLREMILVEEIV